MKNMLSFEPSHHDLIGNEMHIKMESLSTKVDGMEKRMINMDE